MYLLSALPVDDAPETCTVLASVDDAVTALDSSRSSDALMVCAQDDYSRAARVTREVLGLRDVAVVAVGGTATQRYLLAHFLLHLPEAAFGIAPALVPRALAACRTRLAMTSVSRLSDPAPSLRQHVRSLFPRASFDVDLAAGTVTSAPVIDWTLQPGKVSAVARSRRRDRLVVTIDGGEPSDVAETVASPWRAREWVEVTELDPPHDLCTRLAAETPQRRCPVCSRAVATPGCPFCGVYVESLPLDPSERALFPAATKVTR